MKFEKAARRQARLRLAISGPSGSGKTLGALMIAKGLGGRIAVIDTERGSASLYSDPVRLSGGGTFDPPEFDTLDLSGPYTPERYIEAIRAAENAKYDILVIDSATHEWNGVGGCLEIIDVIAAARYRGNTWSAWSEVTPRHRAFLDAILQSPCHVIVTCRSKTETAQQDGGNGKKIVVRVGIKAEQRDGWEYEFTTMLDITHGDHFATTGKDRTGIFSGDPKRITEETGREILAWLNSGDAALPTRTVENPPVTSPTPQPKPQGEQQAAFNAWIKPKLDAGDITRDEVKAELSRAGGDYAKARLAIELLFAAAAIQ